MNDSLSTMLRQLRLGGLAASLEVRLQEAAASKLTHLEFLELILQDEALVRGDRRIERGIKRACFRDARRLEDFDFSFNPSVDRGKVFELASGRFLNQARQLRFLAFRGLRRPSRYRSPVGGRRSICQPFEAGSAHLPPKRPGPRGTESSPLAR